MKILGIDYGSKRVGLAISDESQTLARELTILSPKEFRQQIAELVANEGIERIVIGLPLNMSGEETQTTRNVQEFSDELQQKLSIPIEFMDERLSSVMAENLPGGRKNVDSLAAQIILQNYLDKVK
jgi:putative holliday junction resolvase